MRLLGGRKFGTDGVDLREGFYERAQCEKTVHDCLVVALKSKGHRPNQGEDNIKLSALKFSGRHCVTALVLWPGNFTKLVAFLDFASFPHLIWHVA